MVQARSKGLNYPKLMCNHPPIPFDIESEMPVILHMN